MPIIDLRYATVKSTGEVEVYRDMEMVSGMNVGGDVILGNEITDTTTISGTLNVAGTSMFNELSVASGLSVSGDVVFGDSLTDSTNVSGTLNVAGLSSFSVAHVTSNFSVGGNVTLGDDPFDTTDVVGGLTVSGTSNLSSLNVSSSISSSGDFYANNNSGFYHRNSLTNSWSYVGEKELLFTFLNSDFTLGAAFEIQINHVFGHYPNVKILDAVTLEELITEVVHLNRDSLKIIFSNKTQQVFFPLGNASPGVNLLISLN